MRVLRLGLLVLPLALACGKGTRSPVLDGALGDAPGDVGMVDAGADTSTPDAGTDTGPTGMADLCEACTTDFNCSVDALCGPLSGGERVCLRRCDMEFNDCPRGFECAAYAAVDFEEVCLPVGEVCCIDEDADGFGIGAQCMGPDCDDDDIDRNPAAPELCDGGDQDCDDEIDEMPTDCGVQRCVLMGMGYSEIGDSGCASGACVDPDPRSCGLYTCADGAGEGDTCATVCNPSLADDDTFCIPTAHCDDGGCEDDYDNGEACDEDSDCSSNHCDNGYCCGAGATCCNVDMNCPGWPGVGTVCDTPEDCQGSRGVVSCNTTTYECETTSGVPDDTACTDTVLASDCGLYTDIFCDGSDDQPRPTCPTSCTADSQCDDSAHCDSFCFPDVPDGDPCDEASDCVSGYCNNGFCCSGGDCCRGATDCPGSYGAPAECDDTRACQGTRDVAVCVSSVCMTMADVADDSACTAGLVADTCGLYPSVTCTGTLNQNAPVCPTSCTGDSECDSNAHCDANMCELDRDNGQACDEASDCVSGHCQNGYCCGGGDCCSVSSNCPVGTYGEPSFCNSTSTCQGTRRDPVCTPSFTCQLGGPVDDDSGCNGQQSNACGLYPGVFCSSAMMQPTDQMGLCAMSCTLDTDCDPGAFCNAGNCAPRGMQGDACVSTPQCQSGLQCVDGVCCNSSCTGGCEACNVAGSLGQCTDIPVGTDPAGECGAVNCSSYYSGFVGDTCYRRANAPASVVGCDGGGSCQDAADVCPSQGQGTAQLTCNALCQDPTPGTCTGTSAGACNNVIPSPPTETCGTGQCQVTVNRCIGGTPNVCMEGSPSGETCNDLDDNCNGVIDDGLGGDEDEPNNACGSQTVLSTIITDGSTAQRSTFEVNTLYPAGDADYYQIRVNESGGSDCITTCFDNEHSTVRVTMEVPLGAGSYRVCGGKNSCGSFPTCTTVGAGATGSITVHGDSACCSGIFCSTNNSATFYIRVQGIGAPANECLPYRLDFLADEAC